MFNLIAPVAVAAVACAVLGCNSSAAPTPTPRAPELRLVGDPGTAANTALHDVPFESPVTEGSIMLCVTEPSTATLASVALANPSGAPTGDIRVSAFAVRPNPYYTGHQFVGDARQPLASIGDGFDPSAEQQVSGMCPADNAPDDVQSKTSELAVQVTWSAGDFAGGRDLAVTYDIGGTRATALIPFGIWVCAATCPDGLD